VSLAARVAELSDDELLRRVASGAQSAESVVLIEAELQRRGLAIPDAPAEDDDGYDAEGVSDSLVEFARYGFPIEAQLLRERLEAEGVQAWVVNANVAQAFGYLRDAVGGARVMVRPADVAAAQRVLEQLDAGDFALDDGESGDEATPADVPVPTNTPAIAAASPPAPGLGARWQKAALVIGIPLAITSVWVALQEPKLWWVLLWLPLALLRRMMRRTLK
jgi:hypothetical protein